MKLGLVEASQTGVRIVNNLDAPGGSSDHQQRLLAIRQDPQVSNLARKWVSDPCLAEDALQTAYYKVATVKDPKRIDNLYAYFLTVLKNEIKSLYALRQATTPLEHPEDTLDPGQHSIVVCGPARSRPVDEIVCTAQLAEFLRARLAVHRASLEAAVPARGDPLRYRTVIYGSAEQVLLDGLNGEPSEADSNEALRAAYPEYFAQPGASANLLHQRFRRARADVKALLQAVVQRDELI